MSALLLLALALHPHTGDDAPPKHGQIPDDPASPCQPTRHSHNVTPELGDAVVLYAKPMGRGVCFVMDAETGRPLLADEPRPLDFAADFAAERSRQPPADATEEEKAALREQWQERSRRMQENPLSLFRHEPIAADGSIVFKDLPTGRYRFVAQVWTGVEGLPRHTQKRKDRRESCHILLLGSACVDHTAGTPDLVGLVPFGAGSLAIESTPKHTDGLLLLSRGKLAGHPLAGQMAFGPEFFRGLVFATIRSQVNSPIIVHGVPRDVELEAVLFNFDNLAGVGYGRVTVTRPESVPPIPDFWEFGPLFQTDAQLTMPVFAYWSDGQSTAPAELQPLIDFAKSDKAVFRMLALKFVDDDPAVARKKLEDASEGPKPWQQMAATQRLLADLGPDRVISHEVPGQGVREIRLVDWLAAQSFAQLQARHEERAAQRESQAAPQVDVSPDQGAAAPPASSADDGESSQ